MISEIESNSTNMKPDPEERLNLVGVFALMTLHNKMFPNMDRKLVNKTLELCKKIVCTSLKIKSYRHLTSGRNYELRACTYFLKDFWSKNSEILIAKLHYYVFYLSTYLCLL